MIGSILVSIGLLIVITIVNFKSANYMVDSARMPPTDIYSRIVNTIPVKAIMLVPPLGIVFMIVVYFIVMLDIILHDVIKWITKANLRKYFQK